MKLRAFLFAVLFVVLGGSVGVLFAQSPGTAWSGIDALGRTVAAAEQTGPVRADKTVGIFYFLWHQPSGDGPHDVAKILAQLPEEERKNPETSRSELWGGGGHSYYWGEPLYGYYRGDDPWVLRRHLTLLADAGIDVLIFDTTNAVTYPDIFIPLCEMIQTLRAEGEKTPQITFMLNTEAGKTAEKLWSEIYGTGRFDDLLFRWRGKPLLIGDPEQITDENIQKSLTLRRAHWPFKMINTENAWHWEATYPQPYGWSDDPEKPEQVNVSVAQNLSREPDGHVENMSSGMARGRSFCGGKVEEDLATDEGRNFAEQWKRAYELDPPFVMVTGWNEWIAGRWPRGDRFVFVDQFNREYSRDIEPMNGGHLDNYYLQLIDGVRKYKGTPRAPQIGGPKTVPLDGGFDVWSEIEPVFRDHLNETIPRDFPGIGSTAYKNDSGRNDLAEMKIARDAENVYFYLKTKEPIRPERPDGLLLLLDADGDFSTGWIGGDFLLGGAYDGQTVSLASFAGNSADNDWQWRETGRAAYRLNGNELMISVPFEALSLPKNAASVGRLRFKWLDSFNKDNITPADLYTTGDVAPESRLFYGVQVGPEERAPFDRSELDDLDRRTDSAWKNIWSRFYSPATDLFYDYLTSYEPGRELAHLPTDEEVSKLFPNEFGYGTGMEDCMISGGVVLSAIVDRYAVTGEESLRAEAKKVYAGIRRCSTVPGAPGFVARGTSPNAPEKFYINSSRDQLTHAVYSLWEYFESPLADEATKAEIGEILAAVADRMIRNITPENDFDFLCADGSRCRRGICKMENVEPHEAARLAMIYAAAYRTSGDEKYKKLWREKLPKAIHDSHDPLPRTTTYGLLQMQSSLDLLLRLEPDAAMRADIESVMRECAALAAPRNAAVEKSAAGKDLAAVAPDWRQVGGLVGEYRQIWYNIRESGEIPLTLLLTPGRPFDAREQRYLADAIRRVDFNRVSSCGVYDLVGAWWKAKRLGYF